MTTPVETVPAADARALLMEGLGIGASPVARARESLAARTLRTIESIGFVQVDSIHVVERAHHHILWVRVPGYEKKALDALMEKGAVFEQWTHDASIIPARWFEHWKPRFESKRMGAWVRQRLGKDAEKVLAQVRGRIEAEGPLMSKHFEEEGGRGGGQSGGWWEWKPSKAALEHLWRAGELCVRGRVNFHKVFDLTHRVLPEGHARGTPSREAHVEWACRTAMERLGVATAREVMQFWNGIEQAEAKAWCEARVQAGEHVRVRVEPLDGSKAKEGYTLADWKGRARAARERLAESHAEAGKPLRLLSPFDPLIRDRDRCSRLFDFRYNFEAFVPEKKRRYGYYVLPILDGGRLIGRLDPKADRESGTLLVKGVWWEPGVRETKVLRRRLEEALERYAAFNGLERVEIARLALWR